MEQRSDFKKQYETHLTLSVSEFSVLEHVSAWAESQQLKWTHIVLDAGETPSQPMITFWGWGELASQKARALQLSFEIARLGALVVRVKIESQLDDLCEIPDSVARDGYFENHIKVLLAKDMDLNVLSQIVVPHGARLSRNVRRTRSDGRHERFVTQRVFGGHINASKIQFNNLLAALRQAGYAIVELELEFVEFDSHLALDTGWL
jgi:hypothetical protein